MACVAGHSRPEWPCEVSACELRGDAAVASLTELQSAFAVVAVVAAAAAVAPTGPLIFGFLTFAAALPALLSALPRGCAAAGILPLAGAFVAVAAAA